MIYELKEKLSKFKSEEQLLKTFRIAVENEMNLLQIQLKTIEADIRSENISKSAEEIHAELEKHRFECDRGDFDEILPYLNLLNLSMEEIPKYYKKLYFEGEYEETIIVYDFYDFIKMFNKIDDYMYFVSMIFLSQTSDNSELLCAVATRVKAILRQLNIRIPNYKKSVFIAMSFNPELKSVRDTICKVIENNGFKPVVIDSKEHNNQIVPEIFYEIDKAEFVVADLSEHKAGVYYEAGYAKGVKKPVIFSCRQVDFDKRHFDVAQANTIVWQSESELERRLNARIEAMYLVEETEIEEEVPW